MLIFEIACGLVILGIVTAIVEFIIEKVWDTRNNKIGLVLAGWGLIILVVWFVVITFTHPSGLRFPGSPP